MKIYFSPKASYQYQTLKGQSVQYAQQLKALFLDIKAHPQVGLGTPEALDLKLEEARLHGYWDRRFNGSGSVVYYCGGDFVVVVSVFNELLPSHEELPLKLQKMSQEDYAESIRLMEANRGHAHDPMVGIFWYNVAWQELFGVVSHPLRAYSRANASDDRISCVELHEDVWRREYNRQKYHGDGKSPFIGPYENKPRGRVFYLMTEDRFEVAVGNWLDQYPQAKEMILEEFNLPADKTTFQYAIHWDIGHCWR